MSKNSDSERNKIALFWFVAMLVCGWLAIYEARDHAKTQEFVNAAEPLAETRQSDIKVEQNFNFRYYDNPNVVDIMVNKKVNAERKRYYREIPPNERQDGPSALVAALFGMRELEAVTLDKFTVTLWKSENAEWEDIIPQAFSILWRQFYVKDAKKAPAVSLRRAGGILFS